MSNREPTVDHPELIRKDISQLNRKDKVVLSNLLFHFINYRFSYALAEPSIIKNNRDDYMNSKRIIEYMSASEDPYVNMERIKFVTNFYKKYFVPAGKNIKGNIHNETIRLLRSSEDLISEAEKVIKPSLVSMIDKAENSSKSNSSNNKKLALSR